MRICDYKERDIEEVLNVVRDKLNELTHQDPDSFKITLDYDGFTILMDTETKQRRFML